MGDNTTRHFSSKGTDGTLYEMFVSEEKQAVRIIVRKQNGIVAEYEIPFAATVDVRMQRKTVNECILSIKLNDPDIPQLKYDCGEANYSAKSMYSILNGICKRNSVCTVRGRIVAKQKVQTRLQNKEQGRKEKAATRKEETKSNVGVAFYAILQAIFMGLVLLAWNAGWWPVFIVIPAVFVQTIPVVTWVCENDEKPFLSFGKGIAVSSLIMLLLLTLLPWFATCNIRFSLCDTVFYIHPYEGGFITFSVTAMLAPLLAWGIGDCLKTIIYTDRLWFGKYAPVPFCVTMFYFILMFCAAVFSRFLYIEIYIKVMGGLYAIVSSLFVYGYIRDYEPFEKRCAKRSQVIAGAVFQIILLAIVIILLCNFHILCYKEYQGGWW